MRDAWQIFFIFLCLQLIIDIINCRLSILRIINSKGKSGVPFISLILTTGVLLASVFYGKLLFIDMALFLLIASIMHFFISFTIPFLVKKYKNNL